MNLPIFKPLVNLKGISFRQTHPDDFCWSNSFGIPSVLVFSFNENHSMVALCFMSLGVLALVEQGVTTFLRRQTGITPAWSFKCIHLFNSTVKSLGIFAILLNRFMRWKESSCWLYAQIVNFHHYISLDFSWFSCYLCGIKKGVIN